MASRDASEVRPSSQHRGSNPLAPSARPHSHSVSFGTLNSGYRVGRRKSSSSMAVNMSALAVAARDAPGEQIPRFKHEGSIDAFSKLPSMNHTPRPVSQGVRGDQRLHGRATSHKNTSALEDGPPLASMLGNDKTNSVKARGRRASEGSRLSRGERRRSAAGELRCETCGKGYKHGSCLTKHLWEHTPQWALTSKLLISKHQQVQLLEAASVLVTMNQDSKTSSESIVQGGSEVSSNSPEASESSEFRKDDVSSRTSTPSQGDEDVRSTGKGLQYRQPSRKDSYSSAYSRSYQSTSGHSFGASSVPSDTTDLYYYRQSRNRRPSTASHYDSEDRADMEAAAAGLVSCSLGTPQQRATQLPPDVPPVPPLPAKFAGQSRPSSYNTDIDMADSSPSQRHSAASRARSDEEDDGVFGRMER